MVRLSVFSLLTPSSEQSSHSTPHTPHPTLHTPHSTLHSQSLHTYMEVFVVTTRPSSMTISSGCFSIECQRGVVAVRQECKQPCACVHQLRRDQTRTVVAVGQLPRRGYRGR